MPVRKALFLLTWLHSAVTSAAACARCRPAVLAQVYDGDFPLNLMAMFYPIATVLALGLAVLNWERMARILRKRKGTF